MKFHFHPDADAEFDKAVEYYEQRQSGLGFEFAEEVYAAIARIAEYPDAWAPMSKKHAAMSDEPLSVRSYLSIPNQRPSHYCHSQSATTSRLLE